MRIVLTVGDRACIKREIVGRHRKEKCMVTASFTPEAVFRPQELSVTIESTMTIYINVYMSIFSIYIHATFIDND